MRAGNLALLGAIKSQYQKDQRGGHPEPDPSNYHKAVRLFYVAGNVSHNYLSCSCLQALSVFSQDFPRIGAAPSGALGPFLPGTNALRTAHRPYRINAAAYASPQLNTKTPRTTLSCSNSGVFLPGESPCECPIRTLGPQTKVSLPFPATKENIPKLRESLLDRY